jgi:hypothetical protein
LNSIGNNLFNVTSYLSNTNSNSVTSANQNIQPRNQSPQQETGDSFQFSQEAVDLYTNSESQQRPAQGGGPVYDIPPVDNPPI